MVLKIFLVVISALAALIAFRIYSLKKFEAKQRKECDDIFSAMGDAKPTLEFGSSFGWPTFTVTFRSKEDLEIAKATNLTGDFENYIARYHGPPFEVRRGISFTYEGWGWDRQ